MFWDRCPFPWIAAVRVGMVCAPWLACRCQLGFLPALACWQAQHPGGLLSAFPSWLVSLKRVSDLSNSWLLACTTCHPIAWLCLMVRSGQSLGSAVPREAPADSERLVVMSSVALWHGGKRKGFWKKPLTHAGPCGARLRFLGVEQRWLSFLFFSQL